MSKPSRKALWWLGVAAGTAIGLIAGFFGGLKAAAEFAFRNSLSDAAQQVWLLEQFRSAACASTPAQKLEWMDEMIRAKEDVLTRPEYRELVESDKTIQSFRERTEKTRRARTPGASSSPP